MNTHSNKIFQTNKEKPIRWEQFQSWSLEDKINFFCKSGSMHDVLYAQQFSGQLLDELYILTNATRQIAKSGDGRIWLSQLLRDRKAMLYFVQPSTRTFLSFATACRTLGLDFFDVRSVETSSEVKGESFTDTIRTFSSYFDIIIMRHHQRGYSEKAAFMLNTSPRTIPVINAGSSDDQHPTQALLDIYTLQKSFEKSGGLEGKTVMMVGDLRRGRTVRSLCYLLQHFKKVKLILVSPPSFSMGKDVLNFLDEKKIPTIETDEMIGHLKHTDALYMTRVQDEYDKPGTAKTSSPFKLLPTHLAQMKENAVIMHPLPRRDEIHPDIDHDPRAMYWRQVRNGMWTRVALLVKQFNLQEKILNHPLAKK